MDSSRSQSLARLVSEIDIVICYTEIDEARLEGLEGMKVDNIKPPRSQCDRLGF